MEKITSSRFEPDLINIYGPFSLENYKIMCPVPCSLESPSQTSGNYGWQIMLIVYHFQFKPTSPYQIYAQVIWNPVLFFLEPAILSPSRGAIRNKGSKYVMYGELLSPICIMSYTSHTYNVLYFTGDVPRTQAAQVPAVR